MSLAPSTTWVAGDVLTAVDLNAAFNNILNHPISLFSPTTGTIDFNNNAANNFVVESHAGIVSTASASGRLYLDTNQNVLSVVTTLLSTVSANTGQIPLTPMGGTRVRGLTGTVAGSIYTVAAQEYILRSTTPYHNSVVNYTTASFTINALTPGPIAGGKDQAGAFAAAEIHFYAITTGPYSTSIAGIMSSKPPLVGPTLPTSAGYAFYTWLGAAPYTPGSSATTVFGYVLGSWVLNAFSPSISATVATTAFTEVNLSTNVPPSATECRIDPGLLQVTATAAQQYNVSLETFLGTSTGVFGGHTFSLPTVSATASGGVYKQQMPQLAFPLVNSTPVYCFQITNAASGAQISNMKLEAYKVPNGDN